MLSIITLENRRQSWLKNTQIDKNKNKTTSLLIKESLPSSMTICKSKKKKRATFRVYFRTNTKNKLNKRRPLRHYKEIKIEDMQNQSNRVKKIIMTKGPDNWQESTELKEHTQP